MSTPHTDSPPRSQPPHDVKVGGEVNVINNPAAALKGRDRSPRQRGWFSAALSDLTQGSRRQDSLVIQEFSDSHRLEKGGVEEGLSMVESSEEGSHGFKTPRQVVREDMA